MCDFIRARQDSLEKQEAHKTMRRKQIKDERIDVILFFMRTELRVDSGAIKAMKALGALVPLIPVMCKVRAVKPPAELIATAPLDACQRPSAVAPPISCRPQRTVASVTFRRR